MNPPPLYHPGNRGQNNGFIIVNHLEDEQPFIDKEETCITGAKPRSSSKLKTSGLLMLLAILAVVGGYLRWARYQQRQFQLERRRNGEIELFKIRTSLDLDSQKFNQFANNFNIEEFSKYTVPPYLSQSNLNFPKDEADEKLLDTFQKMMKIDMKISKNWEPAIEESAEKIEPTVKQNFNFIDKLRPNSDYQAMLSGINENLPNNYANNEEALNLENT